MSVAVGSARHFNLASRDLVRCLLDDFGTQNIQKGRYVLGGKRRLGGSAVSKLKRFDFPKINFSVLLWVLLHFVQVALLHLASFCAFPIRERSLQLRHI